MNVATSDSKHVDSCTCPALSSKVSGVPLPSETRWNLVPNPPRLRPRAWSAGSSGWRWRLFCQPRPQRGRRGRCCHPRTTAPNRSGPAGRADLENLDDAGEDAALAPFAEVVVRGLPGAEAFGQIAPR